MIAVGIAAVCVAIGAALGLFGYTVEIGCRRLPKTIALWFGRIRCGSCDHRHADHAFNDATTHEAWCMAEGCGCHDFRFSRPGFSWRAFVVGAMAGYVVAMVHVLGWTL